MNSTFNDNYTDRLGEYHIYQGTICEDGGTYWAESDATRPGAFHGVAFCHDLNDRQNDNQWFVKRGTDIDVAMAIKEYEAA